MNSKAAGVLPLPNINEALPEGLKIKMQLIFYRHDVLIAGWALRRDWKLYSFEGSTKEREKHNIQVWNNRDFQLQYSILKAILPINTFKRWEPCFREFVFYNRLGGQMPYLDGARDFKGDFSIDEEKDTFGGFVRLKIYSKQSGKDWAEIKRLTNKKLEKYEGKWEWSGGTDLRLIAAIGYLAHQKPKLTNPKIAQKLALLATEDKVPENGFTPEDIRNLKIQAQRLGF